MFNRVYDGNWIYLLCFVKRKRIENNSRKWNKKYVVFERRDLNGESWNIKKVNISYYFLSYIF